MWRRTSGLDTYAQHLRRILRIVRNIDDRCLTRFHFNQTSTSHTNLPTHARFLCVVQITYTSSHCGLRSTSSFYASQCQALQPGRKGQQNEGRNKRDNTRIQLNLEMRSLLVEVTVDKFLKEFFDGPHPPSTKNFRFVVDTGSKKTLYLGLCKGFNEAMAKVKCKEGRHAARITCHWPDLTTDAGPEEKGNMKQPDICIYPSTPEAIAAYTLSDDTIANSTYPNMKKTRGSFGRVSWSTLSVPVEVMLDPYMAAFSYADDKEWLPDNENAQKARGQLAYYARQIQARQHRQFLFMIVIIKDHARLLRWDRVGAVISKPFNYIKFPEMLGGFVWRYSVMTPAQRGFDPTATPATKDEVILLEAYAKSLEDSNTYLKTAVNNVFSDGWPIHKIELDANGFVDMDNALTTTTITEDVPVEPSIGKEGHAEKQVCSKRYLLVGRPMNASISATGRGTKCFVAYDMTTEEAVMLKDTWRPVSSNSHPEGEVYMRLYERKVRRNIAILLYCRDVGGEHPQETRTHEWSKKPHLMTLPRIHYRLVFKEIARPLESHVDSGEMTETILSALEAHQEAWEIGEVLHRDISDGNVVIYDDPVSGESKGLLIDWDLAKFKEDLERSPTQKSRAGTWQFMSALLLQIPTKPHQVSDDLESFIHLVNWLTFRFHENTLSRRPVRLGTTMFDMYDDFDTSSDGFDIGGDAKFNTNISGRPPVVLAKDKRSKKKSGHTMLLESLALLVQRHYREVKAEDLLLSSTSSISNSHKNKESYVYVCDKDGRRVRRKLEVDISYKIPPQYTADGVLSNHRAIISAFTKVLEGNTGIVWHQTRHDNVIPSWTNSGTLKRSSEQALLEESWDSDEEPSRKRARPLQTVSEEGQDMKSVAIIAM
ncbi:hypothetical protein A0H81_06530 [Grifola frondosa]|uniref:Fungal-type protein kinase domain-containing protein n=1 Tax=Grifola frondosa TaxID=5627 RepID=A0A1C7MAT1_GRIFR|nr:hypothetical protein A0H81_06530 [Grifola frondosa]